MRTSDWALAKPPPAKQPPALAAVAELTGGKPNLSAGNVRNGLTIYTRILY